MNSNWSIVLALGSVAAAGSSAAAATLPVTYAEQTPNGRQAAWHATLDLRELPARTRPAAITVVVDARAAARQGIPARIAVSLNGLVIGRAWASADRTTRVHLTIEDRLLSTRNHLAVAVTGRCASGACRVDGARLAGDPSIDLAPASEMPLSFAQFATRFREGIAIRAGDARDRALAELAVAAIAPHAPRHAAGPAEVIVSRTTPPGIEPDLRFDRGPVEIRDRDGAVIYDEKRLDALTVVQVATRGSTPVLWVRPGTGGHPAGPIELDYGTLALFGPGGREIAFSGAQDHAIAIAYAADTERDARLGLYWRLGILAVWLAITAGTFAILRRMPPLKQPGKAGAA